MATSLPESACRSAAGRRQEPQWRQPPLPRERDTRAILRLITIPISHYCEKARWALERADIDYAEERHLQGVHMLYARRAGGGWTVPVLIAPEGAIGESELILEWVDQRTPAERRLYPAAGPDRVEVERLCRRFDAVLGPRGRRLMYVNMLAERELMLSFNNVGAPAWEDRALRLGWPVAGLFAKVRLGIKPGIEVEDEALVWRELDYVAELLSDGRAHLCGDRFGAADLTFAALAAAVLAPPVYGTPLPQPDAAPAPIAAMVERAREHPAGVYAMRLYETERRTAAARAGFG